MRTYAVVGGAMQSHAALVKLLKSTCSLQALVAGHLIQHAVVVTLPCSPCLAILGDQTAVSPQELAKFYLGLQSGLFVDMAAQTAAAIQGLSPKINVWNTGAAGKFPTQQRIHACMCHWCSCSVLPTGWMACSRSTI